MKDDELTNWYLSYVDTQSPRKDPRRLMDKRKILIMDVLDYWGLDYTDAELVVNTTRDWPNNKQRKHPHQKYAQKVGHITGKSTYTWYRIWMVPKKLTAQVKLSLNPGPMGLFREEDK